MHELHRWLKLYRRGTYTGQEIVIKLCQMAAEHPPTTFATDIPSDLLTEIRELAASPPSSPDRGRITSAGAVCIGGANISDSGNWEQQQRIEQERFAVGLWAWHYYFAS